jgi:hypothetical protein
MVGWLISDRVIAFKGFWALWGNIYECVNCYNLCYGKAVKGFCPTWLGGEHLLLRVIFMTMCD